VGLRSAVIASLALPTGEFVGALTYLAHNGVAEAVLAGLGAAGASVFLYDRAIN
jgi:hypothetical protein